MRSLGAGAGRGEVVGKAGFQPQHRGSAGSMGGALASGLERDIGICEQRVGRRNSEERKGCQRLGSGGGWGARRDAAGGRRGLSTVPPGRPLLGETLEVSWGCSHKGAHTWALKQWMFEESP